MSERIVLKTDNNSSITLLETGDSMILWAPPIENDGISSANSDTLVIIDIDKKHYDNVEIQYENGIKQGLLEYYNLQKMCGGVDFGDICDDGVLQVLALSLNSNIIDKVTNKFCKETVDKIKDYFCIYKRVQHTNLTIGGIELSLNFHNFTVEYEGNMEESEKEAIDFIKNECRVDRDYLQIYTLC